ncbi:hypothetical protein Drose_19620 [Dactylosporangium roseum]|uniref:Uncharacterized protein n=1 Tax=Dactylosporangium roseum TaxID=47989 RepID=A0ABY5YY01_9ACTN|nr:hypothetical protein [Dactylosporangium roseum]UWZ33522.1 hypothetical protein Drose_19620 [Dactylosporangium roseum]
MGDDGYDYYSAPAIRAATAAIRAEAARWDDFGDRMDAVRAGMAGLGIPASGFAVADVSGTVSSADQSRVYEIMRVHLTTLFTDATAEFHEIAAVLRSCAEWYEDADDHSVIDLDALWHA